MGIVFRDGVIDGVILRPLKRYQDQRGWLCELYREDEVPEIYHPIMGYVSLTEPGIARGPHEHVDQTDYFCFIGPSNFQLFLWDNRLASPTFRVRQVTTVGQDNPMSVIVPPGVVHAYRNVGSQQGLVYNFANRLYRGPGRKEPVDEIRHEEHADTPFRLD
jgi:dTDP-4-dehydrorhamnose 3,5-epimerase